MSTQLSPITLVLQEIQSVTSSMRRNQRWASIPASNYASSSFLPSSSLARSAGTASAAAAAAYSTHGSQEISSAANGSSAGSSGGNAIENTNQARTRQRGMSSARKRASGVDEGDLMLGFIQLRRTLLGVKVITEVDPTTIVDPFLALIRSPLTSGPITSLSLTSLHTLILHVLPIYLPSPPPLRSHFSASPATPLQLCIVTITSSLSQCRFPSSSPQQDELVLLRLLRVIEALTLTLTVPQHPNSNDTPQTYLPTSMIDQMADESVCELLEVGLGMLARGRLSEGLRSTAQTCVQSITRAAFFKLRDLRQEDVERVMSERAERSASSVGGVTGKSAGDGGSVEINPTLAKGADQSPPVDQIATFTVPPPSESPTVAQTEEIRQSFIDDHSDVKSALTTTSIPPPSTTKTGTTLDSNEESDPYHHHQQQQQQHQSIEFVPYGLPTLLELLRVLVALLNPSDQAHTDSMRLSALAVLNSALEVGGTALGSWPELREGLRDEGCRYLFQLNRADSPALLSSSLRTTSTLFSTLLPHLKLQLELFLSYAIDRLTPQTPAPLPPHLLRREISLSRPATPTLQSVPTMGGGLRAPSSSVGGVATADGGIEDSTGIGSQPSYRSDTPASSTPKPMSLLPPVPNETRELMLETLTQIANRPSFMVDCWVNFDCSTESEDIFERLMAFLTRGVYPTGIKADGSAPFDGLDNPQLLCLEILLSFLSSMTDRLEQGDEPWPSSAPPVSELVASKSRKAILLAGAAQFNIKPKNGLAFLEKNGLIIPDPTEPGTDEQKKMKAVAKLLRNTTRLDKKLLGDYISRPDQIELLKAFIGLFDFKGKSIADAMRELLETFRLPGEAQPIARITEEFAAHFFSFNPPEIATQDAVYVLAYSVIMLNTDLHNPQNRKRMTIEDYKRNLRGVNDGKDFDPDYLAGIHESIKKREIILPEEHVGQPGFDYAWKSLIQRSRTAGPMISCNTAAFDEPMFRLSWRPLVSALAYAFTMSTTDEHVIQRAITGFRQCASLAGHFHIPEVFDTIVQSLSTATGLLDDTDEGYQMINYPTTEKDGHHVTVSPLSVRFGQSYRAQLATVVLFTIANGNGSAIRKGWTQIFEMFQTLFLHFLLPTPMLQMEDFLAGTTMIPMKPTTPNPQPDRRSEGGGLLSTLSSYLLSPYGSSTDNLTVEMSEDDIENTLVAIDCLGSCKLEELYAEILSLDVDALIPALQALRALAEFRTTHRLEPRETADGPARFDGQLAYDPACVFLLEMMISLASNGKAHIAETWPIIFEYISLLLSSAQSYSVLLIERAVVGLLRLCLLISEKPELRDQLFIALDVLRSLPSTVLNAVSEQLMAGVARILEKDSGVVKSQTEWGLIIALFRATVAHPEAGKVTLAIVQKMANQPPSPITSSTETVVSSQNGPGLTVDNFAGVVALLDEFATAAGAAAAGRLQQSRRSQGGTQSATLGPTVERGLTALDSLYELRNVIPSLMETSKKSSQDAFNAFWLPPLLVIGKQCVNGCREIRHRAMTYLQRLLLSPQLLSSDGSTLPTIFDRVLFPVLDELLKPQTYERDPSGMADTRLKAATLLCKIFLQYVVRLKDEGRGKVVGNLFVRVLEKLERFMRGERDMLNEVGESLKNVVLVMHSSNLLLPPPSPARPIASDSATTANGAAVGAAAASTTEGVEIDSRTEDQKELWIESSQRIERVLPGFLQEALLTQR